MQNLDFGGEVSPYARAFAKDAKSRAIPSPGSEQNISTKHVNPETPQRQSFFIKPTPNRRYLPTLASFLASPQTTADSPSASRLLPPPPKHLSPKRKEHTTVPTTSISIFYGSFCSKQLELTFSWVYTIFDQSRKGQNIWQLTKRFTHL